MYHNSHPRLLRSFPFLLMLLSSTICAAGCGAGPRRAADVDPEIARQALTRTLECWKAGEMPGSLRNDSSPITAQDLDWEAGVKLIDYKVLETGRTENANLRVPVELVLRQSDGKEATKQVHYVVGTSPQLTVFREMF